MSVAVVTRSEPSSSTSLERKTLSDQEKKTAAVAFLQLLQKDPIKTQEALCLIDPSISFFPVKEICGTLQQSLEIRVGLENRINTIEDQQRRVETVLEGMKDDMNRVVEKIQLLGQQRSGTHSTVGNSTSMLQTVWQVSGGFIYDLAISGMQRFLYLRYLRGKIF